MIQKSPRYLVNFGYAHLRDKDVLGELPQLLMSMREVSHWLAILDPLKIEENMKALNKLKSKGKMFIQTVDQNVVKVIKIQRN